MPAISFSSVEFVRAILEGRKTQTLRPLWRMEGDLSTFPDEPYMVIKKPRLKVGQLVKCYYKQRSTPKDSWFHKSDGSIVQFINKTYSNIVSILDPEITNTMGYFPKHFATVKITEVFEIDIEERYHELVFLHPNTGWEMIVMSEKENFAKQDGFQRTSNLYPQDTALRAMTLWFIQKYNLEQPKKFVAYRWGNL